MSTLTVITLTLNEAHNIGPCLESVRWADEILVIDSGSTDETVAIARGVTQHIYEIAWEGYGAARNFALGKATGQWILWLDADERVTPSSLRRSGVCSKRIPRGSTAIRSPGAPTSSAGGSGTAVVPRQGDTTVPQRKGDLQRDPRP